MSSPSSTTASPTPKPFAPDSGTSSVPATREGATGQGRTTIADTVVSKIAGLATREISGVYALGAARRARSALCASASPVRPATPPRA